jgi:restriction system protein
VQGASVGAAPMSHTKLQSRDAMGAIWFRGTEFVAVLSEMVGFKAGLAIRADRLKAILDDLDPDLWPPREDVVLRIRAERYEEVCVQLLHSLGAGPPDVVFPMWAVEEASSGDAIRLATLKALEPELQAYEDHAIQLGFLSEELRAKQRPNDPAALRASAAAAHGEVGREVAEQFLAALDEYLWQSPFHLVRRSEWQDIRELDELFLSEQLDGPHGEYFDQRFVDFLHANFDDINDVNWRQFEGLAAEYFARSGLDVSVGPGRNDDGVDIRLWPADAQRGGQPPIVLVQCKRQRRKIEKTIVKALWADVEAEKAGSGLVVTSSEFSPGARAMRDARAYPIREANRGALRSWLRTMRTPGTGLFLEW